MGGVHFLDIFIIAAFYGSIILMSIFLGKKVKQKGLEEFAVSSKNMKTFPLICSVAATHIGSGLTLGLIGMMYMNGLQAVWIALWYFIGTMIYTLVLVKRIRKKADQPGWGVTAGDLIEDHMGRKGRFIFGGVATWERIAVTSGQLVAAGLLIATILNQWEINLLTATLIAGVIIIINVSFGGNSAVIWADVLQMIIMLIGLGVLLPFILGSQLAPGTLFNSAAPEFYSFKPTNMAIMSTAAAWFTSSLASQTIWSRTVSAKDGKTAVKANLIGSSIGIVWGFMMVYITFAMKAIYPTIPGNPDSFLLSTIIDGFPVIIVGLILAALLANILSTTNTSLLHAVMNITHDLYAKTFKRNATQEQALKFARITTPIVGIFPVILGIYIPKIIEVQNLGYNLYGAAITAPFWAALLWKKKLTPAGGIAGMIVGLTVSLFFYIYQVLPIPNSILGVICSGITVVIVSNLTRKDKKDLNEMPQMNK
ncbi:sodium:solute symporter family protein [Neobacillus kokaensis]|uniref:Sodium:proline symporter n=1 Tax=Neobacillus kokaensis TaxID=2759023 RepID=A0ABQ3N556_9BACI|nr:sodium:solute symporter family protein [Neobacillus kokaensis]GHH98652.1 sodium:proline symporter [Neobacillus kokaensis]